MPPILKDAIVKHLDKMKKTSQHKAVFPALQDLMIKHWRAFSVNKQDIGKSNKHQHKIELKDKETDPAYTAQFPLSPTNMDFIKSSVKEWVATGMVEPTVSPWNSPIFCVKKKGGQGLRVVLDYRKVNAKSKPTQYSIKTVEECICELGYAGSKVFSALDLSAGFWQMLLEESSRKYSAFTIPGDGQYQWTRGAMGLCGCPSSFSRMMDMVFKGVENILTYIDDIIAHSKTPEEHLRHLEAVFVVCIKNNLKLNLPKCYFLQERTEYLGHVLTARGIFPGQDKSESIAEAEEPRDTREIKRFLGLTNYFRNYVPKFAELAAPLYALTSPKAQWRSVKSHGPLPQKAKDSFKHLKEALQMPPVLAYPTRAGVFHLTTDACSPKEGREGGLGAVLQQVQKEADGTESVRTIGFASRRLKGAEKNYSAFVLEVAAAVFGIQHFQHHLRGRHFKLRVDHKPMTTLGLRATRTLNDLQFKLLDFDFEILYQQGRANEVADYLSRMKSKGEPGDIPINAVYQETLADMATADYLAKRDITGPDGIADKFPDVGTERTRVLQKADPQIQQWTDFVRNAPGADGTQCGPRCADMFLHDDILFIKTKGNPNNLTPPGPKLVVPAALREELLMDAHSSSTGGHQGTFKTLCRLSEHYWWPDMGTDVGRFLASCRTCMSTTDKGKPSIPPMKLFSRPTKPFDRVHVDLWGPAVTADGGKKFVLGMTDALTKYVALAIVPDKSAKVVARSFLENWVYVFGAPRQIVSDSGREFDNDLLRELFGQLNVKHTLTAPYHPQSNAQIETFNKELAHYIKTAIADLDLSTLEWERFVKAAAFAHNTAAHTTTHMAPAAVLFGVNPRQVIWALPDLLEGDEAKFKYDQGRPEADLLHDLKVAQTQRRKLALLHEDKQEKAREEAYNKRHQTKMHTFKSGDLVWISIKQPRGKNPKLAPKYEPGVILELLGDGGNSAKVKKTHVKRKRAFVVNLDRLKPREESEPSPDTEEAPPPPEGGWREPEDEFVMSFTHEVEGRNRVKWKSFGEVPWTSELVVDLIRNPGAWAHIGPMQLSFGGGMQAYPPPPPLVEPPEEMPPFPPMPLPAPSPPPHPGNITTTPPRASSSERPKRPSKHLNPECLARMKSTARTMDPAKSMERVRKQLGIEKSTEELAQEGQMILRTGRPASPRKTAKSRGKESEKRQVDEKEPAQGPSGIQKASTRKSRKE